MRIMSALIAALLLTSAPVAAQERSKYYRPYHYIVYWPVAIVTVLAGGVPAVAAYLNQKLDDKLAGKPAPQSQLKPHVMLPEPQACPAEPETRTLECRPEDMLRLRPEMKVDENAGGA